MTSTTPSPDVRHMRFDIRQIPFSRRGAWLNLSPVAAAHEVRDDIHLVSHRTGMHAVLALVPLRAGERAASAVVVDPAVLRWELEDDGAIEAVFERIDAIRLRGSAGTGIRLADPAAELTPFTGAYLLRDPQDGSTVLTSYETGCRYRVTVLAGASETTGTEALGAADRAVTVTGASESSGWEIVLEEMGTARAPYADAASFDAAAADVAAEFAAYADAIAPWRSGGDAPAATLAAYVLWSATVSAAGFLGRESVLMSKHWMDKVWSWDHCFTALALAPGLPGAALDQFLAPFDHQDASGALPDSIAHSERLFNFVKPPIHGWALRRLRADGAVPAAQTRDVYERMASWTRFWLDRRRAPGRILPFYQHGNDSGWDNSTLFDRDRVVAAPDLAAFLLQQLDVLAELAAELGEDPDPWLDERRAVHEALMAELWTGDGFVARGVDGGESTRTSLLSVMPIAAGDLLGAEVSAVLADRVREFLTDWGPATERVDSGHYESDGYWRGPIWAPATLLIEDGLRRSGHGDLADEVSARFRRLCETSGFAENFDALTGEGLRDRAYTWTAAVYLLLTRAAAKA
ncbi:amylo-alpha-1,6-glucosidase [Microbacterium sp. SORGH_AS_0888]|uniref:amylo-alpha-1,6-glucosidase n=1 Tax=Microbacterium sp. SORGH_AS_0888 TaxID=3041791 RepID=UPI00277E79E4|nr:glycogen debranching protein [Microbacterium sp. SORGH_AS_0888]MDQ1129270.1 hypothetical protein [Microbacterium sp. SORGH_AS_0888]